MTEEAKREEITKELLKLLKEVTDTEVLRDVYYILWRGSLPEVAPEKYHDRMDKKEGPVEFVQRVYGKWLTGEFTKADLRKLDKYAMRAIDNWERYHPGAELPFDLPAIGDLSMRQYEERGGAYRNEMVKLWDRLARYARNNRAPEI